MHQPSSRRARGVAPIGAALLLTALAGACGDSSGPPSGGGGDGSSMEVVGHGAYSRRYTAEVAVRGNTAYTSTWGMRGANWGNAIIVWDVSGPTPVLVDSVIVQPSISTTGDVAVSDDGSLLIVATEG